MLRRATAPLALLAVLLAVPAAAAAVARGELTGFADRAAAVWAGRQAPDGRFLDPRSDRPSSGYGNVFLGYVLMRAGARRGDARLVAAGVRGVSSSLGEAPSRRGVFDLLSMAAAYNFARASLPHDPAVAAALPRWAAYLRATGPPNIENKARACILSPDCFHNHEAVEAAADLELTATGIDPPALGGAAALHAKALAVVGVEEPRFAAATARVIGPHARSGLALLSDSGSWPLAYHALCTAMLARSVELLGGRAPAPARAALRRTSAALTGLMAPDGDVAYIGRRQETIWSLAAAILATERDHPAAADRAFARLRTRYPLTPRGLPIVPRSGHAAFSQRGVDSRPMVFNGLALYLLELAADSAGGGQRAAGSALPADSPGAFVDPAQARFAAVRHGDVWFAVHARRDPPDLRYDSGLIAGKWRSPSGRWIDFVPPRPFVLDGNETAGPVIVRGGQTLHPAEGPISVHAGGTVVSGAVTYRPAARGVRVGLRARRGDTVVYTTYGAAAGSSPAGRATMVRARLASCCALDLRERRLSIQVRRPGRVSFYLGLGAREPAAAPAAHRTRRTLWWPAPVTLAAALAALVLRRRAVVRRRRRLSRRG